MVLLIHDGIIDLLLKLLDFELQLQDSFLVVIVFHAFRAAGLVDDIDRLIREVPVREESYGVIHSGIDRAVFYDEVVILFE